MPIGQPIRLDLSGPWTLTSGDGAITVPLALPGDAISALFDAGVIPDPTPTKTNSRSAGWPSGTGPRPAASRCRLRS